MSPITRSRLTETVEKGAVVRNGPSAWIVILCFVVGLVVYFYWYGR